MRPDGRGILSSVIGSVVVRRRRAGRPQRSEDRPGDQGGGRRPHLTRGKSSRQDVIRYSRCPYICPVTFVRESMCPPKRDDATTVSIALSQRRESPRLGTGLSMGPMPSVKQRPSTQPRPAGARIRLRSYTLAARYLALVKLVNGTACDHRDPPSPPLASPPSPPKPLPASLVWSPN